MATRCVPIVALLVLTPALVHADAPKVAEARAAYDEGAIAYDARNYKAAAVAFARADAITPKETVLRMALTSCVRDGEAVLCMNLVERALARDILKEERESVAQRFARSAAGVVVDCTGPCTAKVDGVTLDRTVPTWLEPGTHALELETSAGHERQQLNLTIAEVLRVAPAPAAVGPQRPPTIQSPPTFATLRKPEERRTLAPVWFWVGAGVTTMLGAAATASGIDTLNRHDTFTARADPLTRQSGLDAQLRTNVFIAGTAGAAFATAILGMFFVRWSER